MAKYEDARVEIIKEQVKIPKLFEHIIVPNMSSYYSDDDYGVNFDVRPVVKCCLHDEDTPSMRYFEETNSFYCYGCGAGGDVIELYRQYQLKQNDRNLSFRECVNYLYDYFIKNNPTTQGRAVVRHSKEINTKFDIMYYCLELEKIEQLVNKIADIDTRIKLFNSIDTSKRLVLLDKAVATDELNRIDAMIHTST